MSSISISAIKTPKSLASQVSYFRGMILAPLASLRGLFGLTSDTTRTADWVEDATLSTASPFCCGSVLGALLLSATGAVFSADPDGGLAGAAVAPIDGDGEDCLRLLVFDPTVVESLLVDAVGG